MVSVPETNVQRGILLLLAMVQLETLVLTARKSFSLTIHRPEPAWKTTESNQFGTDEFMQWCEALGTEPYLALNMGTGRSPKLPGYCEIMILTSTRYAR